MCEIKPAGRPEWVSSQRMRGNGSFPQILVNILKWNLLWIVVILCAACQGELKVFPAAGAVKGWKVSEVVKTYNTQSLFDLVDGQSESYFAYGFKQVQVQRYADEGGGRLNMEVWEVNDPASAFGLFSAYQTGQTAGIGVDSGLEKGRRLIFWQNRYYVVINAEQDTPDADLLAFGRTAADGLPKEGERPTLVMRLPQQGLENNGVLYFHEEISVQNDVWLGGSNVLGLSQKTNGVLGRYTLAGAKAVLILVEYPEAGEATAAQQALPGAQVSDLLAARVEGKVLGAVFGKVDKLTAQDLLQKGLTQ